MEAFYVKSATVKPGDAAYAEYYSSQAGGAMDPYVSYRFLPNQRGNGFFGRLVTGSLLPLIQRVLPYLTTKTIEGVEGIAKDVKEGKSIKAAAKSQLRKSASSVLQDMASKVAKQSGSGIRRRHKRKTKSHIKRKVKRRKTRRTRRSKKTCKLFA